jgi:cellulose synthase operon protein C
MRGIRALVPWVLGSLMAPGWALAQEPGAPPAVSAPATTPASSPAVALLVRQGQRWLDEGRPELAILSVERALSAEPRNADALLLGVKIEAARNNRASAGAYAARLRMAGASADLQAAADASLRAGSIDPTAIETARRLAREGHVDEAAARYRAIFGQGEPPPVYAREYYQTLAATESGRAAGQRGLAQLAARPGADDRTLLANAQALTYAPATRADGISRLAALAAHSGVAAEAQSAWKQALTFYGTDPAATPLLEAYLQRYPDDAEISHRLELTRAAKPAPGPVDPNDALRQSAFAALNSGALRASEQQFETVLAASPGNADALGGLGIVRLRQNRLADAKDLLGRAIAADPARGDQWKKALEGASYGEELTESRALLRRGDVAGADAMLRRAVHRDVEDTTDAESMLGEVALKRGDAAEAEQHFRAALARRPGFATATAGLNQALRAQGHLAEAPTPSSRARAPETGAGSSGNAAADQLRAEASRAGDLTSQAALLSSAMAAAPDDPWIRVDLARALRGLGRGAEGRALVEELAARRPSPDNNYAAALIAQEDRRPADAEAYLAGIPPQRLTADMARLQARLRAQTAVARAAALLPTAPAEARQQLMTLAARPDPTGGTAADAIRALGNAGDRVGAAEAARVAEAANPFPSARIAIAGALGWTARPPRWPPAWREPR